MASFDIHLAIGIRYIEKKGITDRDKFLRGTVDPDLSSDKISSHYSKSKPEDDLLKRLESKVNLLAFLRNGNNIDLSDDYTRGVFLHLITDYLFYNDFLDKDYIRKCVGFEFAKDLYYTYRILNPFLEERYGLRNGFDYNYLDMCVSDMYDYSDSSEASPKLIFDERAIATFIEKVSNIDLEKYRHVILKNLFGNSDRIK